MNLIPQLEREGGHIAVLVALFLVCLAITSSSPENSLAVKAGDLTLGALLLAMKGNGNGKPPTPPPAPAEEPAKAP